MMLWERSAPAQELPGAVSPLKDPSVKPGEEPRSAKDQSNQCFESSDEHDLARANAYAQENSDRHSNVGADDPN